LRRRHPSAPCSQREGWAGNTNEEFADVAETLLIVLLLVMLLAALPSWPYSRSWGMWPSGLLGLVLAVLVLLMLTRGL
jgi:hypothetical protein